MQDCGCGLRYEPHSILAVISISVSGYIRLDAARRHHPKWTNPAQKVLLVFCPPRAAIHRFRLREFVYCNRSERGSTDIRFGERLPCFEVGQDQPFELRVGFGAFLSINERIQLHRQWHVFQQRGTHSSHQISDIELFETVAVVDGFQLFIRGVFLSVKCPLFWRRIGGTGLKSMLRPLDIFNPSVVEVPRPSVLVRLN